ncbi:hypothetical protein NQ314_011073 [Rhamnusium bicolor]|uniref:PLAC domain-containing protein n=1 Tax=Rhamnusium bicolor TaxID=1586634 RepID=A0AAV8XLQ3_9CUCU|nr:hypothetical protein NQ314_011073 [Rhamnusium bicolor]
MIVLQWCVSGYCEEVGNRRLERVPVVLNPQDGGWSDWTPWRSCSRSCGTGVQFRSRKCNNPVPSYGGRACEGEPEEWRTCNTNSCPEPLVDIRAQQCKQLPKMFSLKGKPETTFTWLPYESDDFDKKCKYICVNAERKELFITEENLIDGTPCSYEDHDNICVQGKCQIIGCDGNLNSQLQRDRCGICDGNNFECSEIKLSFERKLKREVSRVSVLPRMAREINVEINVTMYHTENPAVAFVLKNRRKRKYTVTIPNTVIHTKIIEGTKFSYRKYNNRHNIWAKGPLYAEMVILVSFALYLVVLEYKLDLPTVLHQETKIFFTCGEAPPIQKRTCIGNHTRHTNRLCRGRKKKHCKEDQSEYCAFSLLHKYCKLSGFKRLCCKSCANFHLSKTHHFHENNLELFQFQKSYINM